MMKTMTNQSLQYDDDELLYYDSDISFSGSVTNLDYGDDDGLLLLDDAAGDVIEPLELSTAPVVHNRIDLVATILWNHRSKLYIIRHRSIKLTIALKSRIKFKCSRLSSRSPDMNICVFMLIRRYHSRISIN
jgi:hypothetical protein